MPLRSPIEPSFSVVAALILTRLASTSRQAERFVLHCAVVRSELRFLGDERYIDADEVKFFRRRMVRTCDRSFVLAIPL